MNVGIVGGGALGLHTARACLRRGMQVTVMEKGALPNPEGSGYDEHRLIRYPYGAMSGYARLVRKAYDAWTDVFADFPSNGTYLVETGTLALGNADDAWLSGSFASMSEMGVPAESLDPAEAARRYPFLQLQGGMRVLYTPTGGVLLASAIQNELVSLLASSNAVLHSGITVHGIKPSASSVAVQLDDTFLEFDHVVVATGAWNRPSPVPTDLPRVTPSRQVVGYLDLPPSWMPGGIGPMILDLDRDGGLYLVPGVAGTRVKFGAHSFSMTGTPDDARSVLPLEREALLRLWNGRFPDSQLSDLESARSCYYAVADDERIFMHHEGRITHVGGGSGHAFKFTPLIGAVIAGVLDGSMDAYRASRIIGGHQTDGNAI